MNRTNKALILALAIGAAFFRLPLRGDITGAVDGLVKDAATGQLLEGVKITKAPSEAVLYYYRGYGLERSGKSDQALEDYRKAIELKADFVLPLTRSGIVLAKKGAFDKASEFYRRAVDLKD